jgi:beta-N-acetylhexosaminidase
MIKHVATIALGILALVVIFISGKLYDPYLEMIRGWGDVALLFAELCAIGGLLWCGCWNRGGVGGKVVVVLWCLAPLAMATAVTIFHVRKHAVLHAQGARAQELGRHFVVGYSSFDEVATLAAKGLIGGIYVTKHNVEGRSVGAIGAEISALQTLRRNAGLPPLIVATDQEGGIVSHMSPPLCRRRSDPGSPRSSVEFMAADWPRSASPSTSHRSSICFAPAHPVRSTSTA